MNILNTQKRKLVILPTYNEIRNIEGAIAAIRALNVGIRILVVDDNSPDGTGQLVDRLARENKDVTVIHRQRKLGLGSAYVEGFRFGLREKFDYICEMDADFSHDPKYLLDFFENIETCDLVMGSRYLTGVNIVNWSFCRLCLSFFANKYVKLITGMPFSDCNCGFKCFRAEVLKEIDLNNIKAKGYVFQMEVLYRTYKKGFKIKEIPIIFYNRKFGISKMNRREVMESFFLAIYLRFLALGKSFGQRKGKTT
jgi:dolichol-phosphate mannosyltransferase